MVKNTVDFDSSKVTATLKEAFPQFTAGAISLHVDEIKIAYRLFNGIADFHHIANMVQNEVKLQTPAFQKAIAAIGLIAPNIGSGILLTKTKFLTAGHCANEIRDGMDAGGQILIQFNYQTKVNQTSVSIAEIIYYKVKKVLEIGNNLDYGIVSVYPLKKERIVEPVGADSLKDIPQTLSDGEEIVMIGHPASGSKKGSLGKIKHIDNSDDIKYDADSLSGNSGSPVFLKNTGKMIGIHTREGAENEDFNAGIKMLSVYKKTKKIKQPK
jgi:V8-like Glu-specific endopeptidase